MKVSITGALTVDIVIAINANPNKESIDTVVPSKGVNPSAIIISKVLIGLIRTPPILSKILDSVVIGIT